MTHDATYAHCITGRAQNRVLARGKPLVRFEAIVHADGATWRYEGLCRDNTAVVVSKPGAPRDVHRFSLEAFGITVVVEPPGVAA